MHTFVAQEDSCFFDICLPNYTEDSLRKITYFDEISSHLKCDLDGKDGHNCSETSLQYATTPPVYPKNMNLTELDYVGDMKELYSVHSI
jgi:hypothetical protein